jgi:Dolichyl-phosphate-mannose-protein mannosyltransferase
MIDSAPRRLIERTALVHAACAASFAIALLFIFVRAPHPWGWEGFDHYHEIALELARGRPFPTLEVPWGYAYSLAVFYWLFGDHPWIPLVAQAALNAAVPALVFRLAATWIDRRTAILAAVLTGLFSFNTVYASTQSSDAVCTCLFMAAIAAFVTARQRESGRWFAIAGVLSGVAPQFRPNLILIPLLLAAFAWWEQPSRRRTAHVALLLACAAAALLPWVVRNYRLTRQVLPTSVHGGVQLWYGTLQVGPYLHSRAYNPRSLFDAPAFEYTSLEHVPIVVEAQVNCTEEALDDVALAYWSDRSPGEARLRPARIDDRRYTFEIPAPGGDAVVYYYFVTTWSGRAGPVIRTTPHAGARAPFIYFVSSRHLDDLDVHGELLDVFDVVRLIRYAAWNEPVPFADRLRAAGAGDARAAIAILMRPFFAADADRVVTGLAHDGAEARVTFRDGSTLVVPRQWSGRITDLTFSEGAAASLMTSRVSLRALDAPVQARPTGVEVCTQAGDVEINQVFYRREPHMMGRYAALAFDNIRRDPTGFVLASAYRAVRMFVIEGTSDRLTAQQFSQGRRAYAAGEAFSIVFLALFGAGVIVAWRRGNRVGLPLLLIAYIPATLAPVLTNMRYTVTVQPLMFMFIAVALTALTGTPRRDDTAPAVSHSSAG